MPRHCPHCRSKNYTITVNGGTDYVYADGKRVASIFNRGDTTYQCDDCGRYFEPERGSLTVHGNITLTSQGGA